MSAHLIISCQSRQTLKTFNVQTEKLFHDSAHEIERGRMLRMMTEKIKVKDVSFYAHHDINNNHK